MVLAPSTTPLPGTAVTPPVLLTDMPGALAAPPELGGLQTSRGPETRMRTSREGVAAGMRAMGITAALLIIPLAMVPLPEADLRGVGHIRPATWAVIASAVATLVGLWLRPRSRLGMWFCGALLLAATLWWMPLRVQLHALNWWAPGFWAIPWVCWSVTLVTRRTFAVVNALVLGLLTVLDPLMLWLDGIQITAQRLAPVPWFTMPVAMMALFGYGLDLLARQADHQMARRLRAEHSREVERAEKDASREAARLLHDHVLHALHAISRGSGAVPHAMVVEECRTAVAAIDQVRDSQVTARLEDLLVTDPALVRAGARLSGHSDPVPKEVARAMVAATHEALVNVARHAHATHAEVDVAEHGFQWHITIRDDGRGFDPTRALAQGRLGLRHSVQERLEDAGGASSVVSSPGQGTTVRLVWPALDDRSVGAAWPRLGSSSLAWVLARTSWPALAITPFMAVLAGSLLEPAWPMRTVAALLVVWGVWWLRRLRHHQMTIWGQVAIFVGTTLAWWLNLWLAPEQMETVYPLWIGWTAAGLVHLAVLQVPLVRGAVMLGLWGLVQEGSLVYSVGLRDFLYLHISLTTGIAEGLVALVALQVARAVAEENASQAQVAEAMRRAASHLQAETHVAQYWSERVTDVALPLLRTVAEGSHDPGCPVLEGQARRLEATLRDELVLGPGHEDFLDSLGRLRQAGWTVNSTLDDEHNPGSLAELGEVLDHAGLPATAGQLLTLSGTSTQLVALVVSPSLEQQARWSALAEACQVSCDVDPDFVRVSVPLAGSGPAPG